MAPTVPPPSAAPSPSSWVPCVRCGGSSPARAATCGYCGAPNDPAPDQAGLTQLGLRIQELIGNAFTVDGLLGCGPHGCTFRAREAGSGIAVALKFARLAAA